jgi:hypothetical protein
MKWDEVLTQVAIRHVCTIGDLYKLVDHIETYPQTDEWKIAIVELFATLMDLGHPSNRLLNNLPLILNVLYAKRLLEETVLQDMENMEVLDELRLIREE